MLFSGPPFSQPSNECSQLYKRWLTECVKKLKLRSKQVHLGSWNRAVTSADGSWMTRGHHSKNFTFSIRNYYTGALLYRKHLCQKGRYTFINEDLYQGTSKGAEGYAARLTLKKAKREGINIAGKIPTPPLQMQ